MRIAPNIYPIVPELVRESCEVLWEPDHSRRLQAATGIEDLWVGFHSRRQKWCFGVWTRVAITESAGGLDVPVEHRDMVVHQSDWNGPFDEARMAKAWIGLKERTEAALTKMVEDVTAEARKKKIAQGRAERRYVLQQYKKQIKQNWDSLCGYTGIIKGPDQPRIQIAQS